MFEMEEGWLFHPGKVKGVRWTVHEVRSRDQMDEAEAMTSGVFQLLAGVKVRRVFVLRLKPLVITSTHLSEHENYFFYVAEGVMEFATIHCDDEANREMRVLYPGHGVVIPQGVVYAMSAFTSSILVVGSDVEDSPPATRTFATVEIPWLVNRG